MSILGDQPVRRILLIALGLISAWFAVSWWRSIKKSPPLSERARPSVAEIAIGAITNFFDTLGIGSFAPTTAVFRLRKIVTDEEIPGTLNVGHTAPSLCEAFIFIAAVSVDPKLLVSMLAASIVGSWVGAGVVVGLDKQKVQRGMALALLVAATLFALKNVGALPAGGNALALEGGKFWFAVGANFVYGALMTLGIGLFGPCMITLALLGVSPIAAFPIMMASCAFLMPVASVRFMKAGRYRLSAALGLTLGGVPAVFVAAYLVKELPLVALRWLVVAVVSYVAVTMLRASMRSQST
jgi:uncharacterized membrane protein YfcA